ncbi:hypothetical protein PMI42_03292 [Bradyrhizobium sp. YR681]|uniref:hypothetical protein n=1 Tax=Bradyrhizobium sp. YR681 TaxID=1144344 RepID=UPI0002714129|nr:hypothetical protein [Bradyrhizobium sp. YR681]EJN13436.1 hypothetical protein PMI42_03292 [Bradyrhizobium sp. YR681]
MAACKGTGVSGCNVAISLIRWRGNDFRFDMASLAAGNLRYPRKGGIDVWKRREVYVKRTIAIRTRYELR